MSMPIYPGLIGKVAVVSGASSGIGAETARYLAASMVTVVAQPAARVSSRARRTWTRKAGDFDAATR